jgi:hypothetical protein
MEGSANPVKKQKDLHCLSKSESVAHTNEDGNRYSAHQLWEEVPDERKNEIVSLDFL